MDVKYSKEIAKVSGKIGVFLPGEQIELGDIIQFPNGNNIFGVARPLGNFRKITSLKKLGIFYEEPEFSKNSDSYLFSSSNSKITKAKLNIETPSSIGIKGELSLQFTSEGAIYFSASECGTKRLEDLTSLENQINVKGKEMVWKDTFLVVALFVAKKAFIVQSRTKNSEVLFDGKFDNPLTNSLNIAAETSLNIKEQKGSVFMKDWSENVSVFMDVVRFEKTVFDSKINYRNIDKKEKIILKKIHIEELINN